jgi:serine kinase of HPr protein (carbohydrate metabolism regulator)
MPEPAGETVHASCVLVGARALLIRGPAGSGKSQLALALIDAARSGRLPFTRLVADDRVRLAAVHGRLIASAPEAIRGLIEVYGLGIRHMEYEPSAVVGLVVDLAASDAARLPPSGALKTALMAISLPRLPIAPGEDPLPIVLACISTAAHA